MIVHTVWKAALLGSVTTVLLVGCDMNLLSDPLAIKRDGDQILIAVCAGIEAGHVFASVRRDNEDWLRFWDAEGGHLVAAGDILVPEQGVPGLTTNELSPPGLSGSDEITVTIVSVDQRHELGGYFETSASKGLSEDLWLQTDGEETSEPCHVVAIHHLSNWGFST